MPIVRKEDGTEIQVLGHIIVLHGGTGTEESPFTESVLTEPRYKDRNDPILKERGSTGFKEATPDPFGTVNEYSNWVVPINPLAVLRVIVGTNLFN